jgi:hypothetical protein
MYGYGSFSPTGSDSYNPHGTDSGLKVDWVGWADGLRLLISSRRAVGIRGVGLIDHSHIFRVTRAKNDPFRYFDLISGF